MYFILGGQYRVEVYAVDPDYLGLNPGFILLISHMTMGKFLNLSVLMF